MPVTRRLAPYTGSPAWSGGILARREVRDSRRSLRLGASLAAMTSRYVVLPGVTDPVSTPLDRACYVRGGRGCVVCVVTTPHRARRPHDERRATNPGATPDRRLRPETRRTDRRRAVRGRLGTARAEPPRPEPDHLRRVGGRRQHRTATQPPGPCPGQRPDRNRTERSHHPPGVLRRLAPRDVRNHRRQGGLRPRRELNRAAPGLPFFLSWTWRGCNLGVLSFRLEGEMESGEPDGGAGPGVRGVRGGRGRFLAADGVSGGGRSASG